MNERAAIRVVAEAIGDDDERWEMWEPEARAALEALRRLEIVYRNEDGDVVHELRGEPTAIWRALLDGMLSPPPPAGEVR
jgi:hypothetical protein